MKQLSFWRFLAVFFVPTFLGAATVTSIATCGRTSNTSAGVFVSCLSGGDYASAYGSATRSGNTINISASSYSVFSYSPYLAFASSSAETTISDAFTTGGAARAGYAEIIFDSLSINQNTLFNTNAALDIVLNGSSVYSCDIVIGIGWSACPTATVVVPIELGTPFVLSVNDSSYSPTPDFVGGISTQFEISLLEADHSPTSRIASFIIVPEPGVWGLLCAGLCVAGFKVRRSLLRD